MSGRTAKYHYSLGKLCLTCQIPIVNKNRSGHCQRCHLNAPRSFLFKSKPPLYNSRRNDSLTHQAIKRKAMEYLYSLGHENVRTEFEYKPNGQRYIIDVVALTPKGIIAIECGDLNFSKVLNLARKTYQLMVWPYKYKKPVRIYVKNRDSLIITRHRP